MAHLSKSRFLDAQQCDLRLWYQVNAPELATAEDMRTALGLAVGREVGELARHRYPGGRPVEGGNGSPGDALASTRQLLVDPQVPAIFEAAFEHKRVLVRTDILARSTDGGWDLVEVKSGTRIKDLHLLDVAIQLWVLKGAGVLVRRAGVLTLDREYVWAGGKLDLGKLFTLHDCTEQATAMLAGLDPEVTRLLRLVKLRSAPEIEPGPQCTSPYTCPFLAHCSRELVEPEWPLSALPALSAKRRDTLEDMGIDDIRDIPDDFQLSVLQSVARDAVLAGEEVIHGDLSRALASARYPVHHLDFESIAPAVPRFPGTRAYDPIPFQFSVHSERADGKIVHHEYLHPDASDPREPLARALLDALGDDGSIAVYTSFEKTVISSMAGALHKHESALESLLARLWDLHAVVRNSYYHPEFRGSFSMKSVLPALAPELDYGDLEIADGELAAASYEHALRCRDEAERERIFKALRAYCSRDTLGLLKIRKVLAERVKMRDEDP